MLISRFPYRTVVLATLIWLAVGFALTKGSDPGGKQEDAAAAPKPPEVGAPETFGAKLLSDPTAFFTMALAALTAVLAGTAAGQIYYLRRTDETARQTAEAAFKAAVAAERSASLAETALLGLEAPFIFATATRQPVYHPIKADGSDRFASYVLHNHGRSPAIVREVYPGAIACRGLPAPIAFPPPQTALHKVQVIAAGSQTEPWILRESEFTRNGPVSKADPADTLWIIGQVRYTDPFGTQYLTGFCFAHNPSTRRFYAQGGTAYNYRRRLSEDETRTAEARDAEVPTLPTPPADKT